MNEDKFTISMSQVKIFLPNILKLLLPIVFFNPFLALTSMSSDVIVGGIVSDWVCSIMCHSEVLVG